MHPLTRLRRASQESRQQFRGETSQRPLMTASARGLTGSDMEALECVEVAGQNEDGTFVFLPGYDDLDDLLP